jgi:PHD/YefM family antitoxin component YafN of YafNO toxin-antitoxin module
MKKTVISVTYAARNFFLCIDRVKSQKVALVLTKNGKPVARLEPESEKICTGRDLARALAETSLTDEEAAAWHRDMQQARKALRS